MASRLASWFERAMLPLGVVALGVLVWSAGTENVLGTLRRVGVVWFVAVILQEIVAHALNTLGLLVCLPHDRERLPFWRTFAARLAGEGVNATMPTATIGGELLKISLLARDIPPERVTAGVTAAYATQTLGQMLFTAFALPFALDGFAFPHVPPLVTRLVFGVCVGGGTIFAYLAASVLRTGAFARMHWALRKVGLGTEGSSAHATSNKIDEAARAAHGASPGSFAASTLSFLAGWCWGMVEVAMILSASGYVEEVTFLNCLAIESLSSFIDALCLFVPGQIGTSEGGLAAITYGLGIGADAGITIGLVRRGRRLAWAGLGIACLAWFRRTGAASPAPAPAAPPPSGPIAPEPFSVSR